MKDKILSCIIFFIILLLICPFYIQSAELGNSQSQEEITKEGTLMKVNFYAVDREKVNKGKFLGTAEIREGRLFVDVIDPKLEKLLKEPYTTMRGEVKDGVAVDRMVTLQPGTVEHLKAIAVECWQFGYIGEVVEK